MRAALTWALLSLPLSDAAPAPAAPDPPVLREVVLEGVNELSREDALRATRLREGTRLRREPSEIARSLAVHYASLGFLAARVEARFDPAPGRLTLTADEGRLGGVALEGVSGETAARARALLGLETGRPLRDGDVRAAIRRLERASGGAFRAEGSPWPVDTVDGAARLHLRVHAPGARVTPVPAGPDPSPFQNRVEGTAPGLGAEVTLFDRGGFHHATVTGAVSWGSSSEAVRYAAGISRPFGPGGRVVAGAEVHDLTDTDDAFRRRLVEEPRGRSVPLSIVEDYYRRKGAEAFVFLRAASRFHLGASFRADRHQGLPVRSDDRVLLFFRRDPRPNPAVGEGDMRSLLLTARYSRRAALYADDADERRSFLVRDPYGRPVERAQELRADATLEWARAGALGGDFDFTRLIAHVHASHAVGERSTLSARALLGATGGTPPQQRRFALGGAGTLRGYALREFAGDHAALLSAEWMLQPRSRYPALVAFWDGGVAWTSGVDGDGWRNDVGIGLEWPGGGRARIRADVALPLQPTEGRDKVRVHALLRVPF